MGRLSNGVRRGLTAFALSALAGCGQPAWRDPDTARGSAVMAPDVLEAAAERRAAIPSANKAQHVTNGPRPGFPEWAAPMIDKPLRRFFGAVGRCQGNTDNVKMSYRGKPGGALLVGWGWDPDARQPVQRVIVVDNDLVIVGAGETGLRRRDVPRAVPSITSETTGWSAVTFQSSGPVVIYGLVGGGATLCRLGRVDL